MVKKKSKTSTQKKSAPQKKAVVSRSTGKKAIKNAKVTFKFNGKTYKTKTNKYGIAKVTIKKSVLKKCQSIILQHSLLSLLNFIFK